MKFTLATSALLFVGFAAAGDYGSVGPAPHSQAPPPAPAPSGKPAPPPVPKPPSYPPPKSASVDPWHPTTLPHCEWCTATVTCTATEWVSIGCTTTEPWTKCELPASTCKEATLTVIIPCTTTKVPETPICVVTTVAPAVVTEHASTKAPAPVAPPTTLPIWVSGGANLKSGAFAGAAVAIAAAGMVFV